MNQPVVKSGLHVYKVRPREDHRNVGFRCAAVWSVVVAKVTGTIGYARHQSRSRDALISQDSMRYKNFVVFTALALPALTHVQRSLKRVPTTSHISLGHGPCSPTKCPSIQSRPICFLMERCSLWPDRRVTLYNHSKGAESYRAAVWDPSGTDESSISVHNLTYDVFCSGTAALFDGRSLIVGGTAGGDEISRQG